MTATVADSARIFLTPDESSRVRELSSADVSQASEVVVRTADGREIALGDEVNSVMLRVLRTIVDGGEVAVTVIPEDLTSTMAADLLGISRPTLMKWAREKKVDCFYVGTHTRFKLADIEKLKRSRTAEQKNAFEALREFEATAFGPAGRGYPRNA